MDTQKRKFSDYFTLENVCFAGMQTFYWAAFCILFAYIGPYILSLGCSNTQLGVIISANSVASVIGQPVFGYICDKTGTIKKVMVASFLGGAILAAAFFFIGSNYYAILILSTVIAFVVQAVYPIIDSWTVLNAEKNPTTNYGITRAIGSIGYAITAGVVGGFFEKNGFHWIFILFIAMMILSIVTCFGPKDTVSNTSEPLKLTDIKKLFTNFQYISFVVISTLLYIAYKSCSGFLPVLMESVGGTTTQLGYAWSVLGLSEFPALLLAGIILTKVKDSYLIVISMFFFILRVALPSFATTPTQLIYMTALQGLSYGLFLPASVKFISRVVVKELSSTAQTFAVAMYSGVGISVSGIVGGILSDAIGIVAVYRIAAVVIAVMTVAFGLVVLKNDRLEKEQSMGKTVKIQN